MEQITKQRKQELEAMYPAGSIVKCYELKDEYAYFPPGTYGEVIKVDDAGLVHVLWDLPDSKIQLAFIPGVDKIEFDKKMTVSDFYEYEELESEEAEKEVKSIYWQTMEALKEEIKDLTKKSLSVQNQLIQQHQLDKIKFLEREKDVLFLLDFMSKHLPIEENTKRTREIIAIYLDEDRFDIESCFHNPAHFIRQWEHKGKK